MAAVPFFCSLARGFAVAFNNTYYVGGFPPKDAAPTTETNYRIKWGVAGVLNKMEVLVRLNTIATSNTTVKSRLNSAASAGQMTCTIAAGTTGSFTDFTNGETIAVNDYTDYQIVTPNTSGSITISAINTLFAATTNTVSKFAVRKVLSATGVNYFPLSGGNAFPGSANEAYIQVKAKTAGTLKNFYGYVYSSTTNTSVTLTARVNGADAGSPGNLAISWTAAQTGEKTDFTNTVTVAVDDLLSVGRSGAAGAGNLHMSPSVSSEFETTDGTGLILASIEDGGVFSFWNASTTNYTGVGGDGGEQYTTEAATNVQAQALAAYTVSKLQTYLPVNTVSAASTLKLRKNGANGNQSVSLTASTTGFFDDASNSDALAATDTIDYQCITGATGTKLGCGVFAMLLSQTAAGGLSIPVAMHQYRRQRAA